MPRMKGADLITEHLIRNKMPYVFGIAGTAMLGC
jgi:thiamine pyrophosphate-dependent acetolactate synthase large subunit-like protein